MNTSIVAQIPLVERAYMFGLADPAIADRTPNPKHLVRQIKAITLLGGRVLVPAPFIWQSEKARKVMRYCDESLSLGLFGLTARPELANALSYVRQRENDTLAATKQHNQRISRYANERPGPNASDHAKYIDEITRLVPRPMSVEHLFKKQCLQDAESGNSIGYFRRQLENVLPARCSSIMRRHIEAFEIQIAEDIHGGHCSRATVAERIVDTAPRYDDHHALLNRLDANYQLASAHASNARLLTTSQVAAACPSNANVIHPRSVAWDNPRLLLRVLRVIGIPLAAFDRLSFRDVYKLANDSPELTEFRQWYTALFEQDRVSSTFDLVQKVCELGLLEQRAKSWAKRFNAIDKMRFDWISGAVCAAITFGLGGSPAVSAGVGWRVRSGSRWCIELFRKRLAKPVLLEANKFQEAFMTVIDKTKRKPGVNELLSVSR